ncbi:aldo/keto reductase [Vibrio sp. CAIM 722]|uniref:Aldo/keto reductase n=1 Tax=Vibrio eleionomae TaxID=2653505 RepID=A0A7X4RVE0_9VIBR|nr:aldo/keto reductase [Vibrio eleionomae]MZI94881.1 aldo/keto reductase [Vibrio eleionomae]
MADITLPSGNTIPNLGLGTWYMGEGRSGRQQEVDALRFGIEYGARLIDTAEMYGEGEAERITGDAMQGLRDHVYLVSKFYPHNAGYRQVIQACERSLQRLQTDHIDLYLLHWRGSVPFNETLEALYQLQKDGKILEYGVSNLDVDDMEEFDQYDIKGLCATDQVLYNLARREADFALKPFLDQRNISMMAYCPLDQGGLLKDRLLNQIAQAHQATPAQIALAWLLQRPGVIAIPKSSHQDRVKENLDAANIQLSASEITLLDEAYPVPQSARQARIHVR